MTKQEFIKDIERLANKFGDVEITSERTALMTSLNVSVRSFNLAVKYGQRLRNNRYKVLKDQTLIVNDLIYNITAWLHAYKITNNPKFDELCMTYDSVLERMRDIERKLKAEDDAL